jgi:adenine-specific DNA-methyltransferase
MFTYLGNKRKLLDGIEELVIEIKNTLGVDTLRILDGFTGSTVVARMLANHASIIHTNDLEYYSFIAAKCFLERPDEIQKIQISNHINKMNSVSIVEPGIITTMYAPKNTNDIKEGERCYFTRENALRIDYWRNYVDKEIELELKYWVLCPILIAMSINSNSMGHFKSFIKRNGVGSFTMAGQRVIEPLSLELPIYNPNSCKVYCHKMDTVELLQSMSDDSLDLIYLDPPYNQHEYGAFYFLLNVVANNVDPGDVNVITGLPKNRVKSSFNYLQSAKDAMTALIQRCTAVSKFTIVSYNDEGLLKPADWDVILEPYTVRRIEKVYQRYSTQGTKKDGRGEVIEILYLITKP